MSDRNALKQKIKDLLILQYKGQTHELWGLVRGARDKRLQSQLEIEDLKPFIQQLSSKDPKVVETAKYTLIYYNAYYMAALDRNFSYLESLGVKVPVDFKRRIYSDNNAAQRDYVNNNIGAQDELTDFIDPEHAMTIGDLMDSMKAVKRSLKAQGKSIADMRNAVKEKSKKPVIIPLPVKIYSAEEKAKFSEEYFKNKSINKI